MQKVGILGYGEVGRAIAKFYQPEQVKIKDLNRDDSLEGVEVLNICIPWTDAFVNMVKKEIKKTKPKLTIIHSTVAPGATRKIGGMTVHSPVRGIHPELYQGIKTFIKYIGADNEKAGKMAKEHLESLGIKTKVFYPSLTTELGKLFSTTYYGLCIAWHGEMKKICDNENVDFEKAVTDFNETYNQGYKELNKNNVIRPVLYPPNKNINGHCICENTEILKKYYNSQPLDLILKYRPKKVKAIIIAAGPATRLNPLTNDKPKCLLKIKGKTILERQLEILRGCGINDISVIRGYKAEMINFPGIKYYLNKNYENNNILNSLFCAEKEMNGEFIVMYSDILFDKSVVEKLLESEKDISSIVDTDWQEYYQGRTKHPIEEAENVVMSGEKIVKIGKHLRAEESDGEFIGMAKFSKKGGEILKREFQRVKDKYWGKSFQKAKTFEKAYLTDMVQELIDRGYDVFPVKIQKNWWEIDTDQDLEKVKKIFSS